MGGLVLVLVMLLVGLTGCSHEVSITPPKAPADDTGQHAQLAQQTLSDFVRAVRDDSRTEAVQLAASGSSDLLGWVQGNAHALGVDDLSLRYVDEGDPLSVSQQDALGPGAWRATVQMSYRYAAYDTQPARVETSVVFVPHGSVVRIAQFGGGSDQRTPLWLVERLSVVRTPRSMVAVAASTAGRFPRLVTTALHQIGLVLPRWKGPLVVEVPRTEDELDDVLDAQPGEYDNIAAVTTSADGSLAPGAPVRVFVNPDVFDRLQERGAQVVMSHEGTHVATGATFASMPTWLLEGFADYVALAHAGVPVSLAARQILARIRKDGVPHGLPTAGDLDPTANGLGATYEEAWLACRFLGQQYGTSALVRFYRQVDQGASLGSAFRQLGTTQRAFVASWRADLARLAGVAG